MPQKARGKKLDRNRERGEETRAAILETALEVFGEMSYESASIRVITRKVGVSHNIIHYHFGSKMKVWEAALDYGFGKIVEEVGSLYREARDSDQTDPGAVIMSMVKASIEVLARRPALARIMAREAAQSSKRMDYIHDRFTGPPGEAFQRFLTSRQHRDVRDFDPRMVLLYLLGGSPALQTHKGLAQKLGLNTRSREVNETYRDTAARLLVYGLVASA